MTPPLPFEHNSSHNDDYEEISSIEVDRVVQILESLMQEVSSENIRAYLDEAADNIFALIYDANAVTEDGSTDSDDLCGEAA